MSSYGPGYGRAMVRGGRNYSSSRGSYRGSSRGSSWNTSGGYERSPRDKFSSFDSGYYKGSRYGGSERYSRMDDYPKAYRMDNYSSRDRHSPERKRPRTEGRHDSYGGGRYDSPYPSERRGYSGDRERHFSTSSPYRERREDFRRPPPPSRGSTRGRISSRGSRGLRRERGGGPPRRRMAERSYMIRKPRGMIRSREYPRRSKLIRLRSTISRRRRALSIDKESSGDEKEDGKEPKEKKEKGEKSDGEADKEVKEGEEKGDEKMEVTEEGDEKKEKSKEKKEKKEDDKDKKEKKVSNYVKLVCPQCNIKVATFRRYEAHLQGRAHLIAMRKTAAKQRSILAQMRQAQRNAQNELEKSGENITDHTVFCPLCKLNYKQERKMHQNSAAHKNMRKFLLPDCKVCKINFKSPMVYENHLCSIDHMKRKQRLDNASDAEEDNLDEFTTIDSVGEMDENAASNEEAEREEKKKVSVGIELIKKIDAYYCDLCRMFLPRGTENEAADILAGHCRKRFHMQRYIRHKENEELKKRAEKLQRKETAEKKKKDEPKKEGDEASAETSEAKEPKEGDAKDSEMSKSADDDKLWEAVDKDLGELLEEGNKSDDDDEDSRVNGERFDRFKSAEKEKNGEEAKKGTEETEKAAETPDGAKKEEESKK